MNRELPDIQAGFRKGRGARDKLSTSVESWEKQESSRKISTSALLTVPKPLTVWITTNCGKFFKRWGYQTTLAASWEICMQVKKQQFKPDMEQWACSKLGREYVKAVYCHPAYLTSMQSTSWEMPTWIKHKLESRLPGKISITSDTQVTPPLWHHPGSGRPLEKEMTTHYSILAWRRTKEPLDESERGEWKSWLKTQQSEN